MSNRSAIANGTETVQKQSAADVHCVQDAELQYRTEPVKYVEGFMSATMDLIQ